MDMVKYKEFDVSLVKVFDPIQPVCRGLDETREFITKAKTDGWSEMLAKTLLDYAFDKWKIPKKISKSSI